VRESWLGPRPDTHARDRRFALANAVAAKICRFAGSRIVPNMMNEFPLPGHPQPEIINHE